MNALAAAGAAWLLGIPGEAAARGLATFSGADRRMQLKGRFNGADVYDDYAHHPDELRATIEAVRTMDELIELEICPDDIWVYDRTKNLHKQ
jgi:UDP-N-acetylmuramate--alanine ligase